MVACSAARCPCAPMACPIARPRPSSMSTLQCWQSSCGAVPAATHTRCFRAASRQPPHNIPSSSAR
eukprot:5654204-Alexandrium_andersonii.AAC.1